MLSVLSYLQQPQNKTSCTGKVLFSYSDGTYHVETGSTTIRCRRTGGGDTIPQGSLVMVNKSFTGQWYIISEIGVIDSKERKEVIIDG
jgi:hypothetical protein